jgi:hypothetical protein
MKHSEVRTPSNLFVFPFFSGFILSIFPFSMADRIHPRWLLILVPTRLNLKFPFVKMAPPSRPTISCPSRSCLCNSIRLSHMLRCCLLPLARTRLWMPRFTHNASISRHKDVCKLSPLTPLCAKVLMPNEHVTQ